MTYDIQTFTAMFARPARMEIEDIDEQIDDSGRRELIWKSSRSDVDLTEILQEVESFLLHLRSSSRHHLRQYNVAEAEGHHLCPGYRREEILLATTLDQSLVVFHSVPRPSERCTVCGQLVDIRGKVTLVSFMLTYSVQLQMTQ